MINSVLLLRFIYSNFPFYQNSITQRNIFCNILFINSVDKYFRETLFIIALTAIIANVWLPDVVADLATEFSPLAQNENSKKERTIYRKPAIAFDSGYKQFFYSVRIYLIDFGCIVFCSSISEFVNFKTFKSNSNLPFFPAPM